MIKMVLLMIVTKVICNVVMMKIMRLMSMGGFVTQERRSPINPPTTLLCNTLLGVPHNTSLAVFFNIVQHRGSALLLLSSATLSYIY